MPKSVEDILLEMVSICDEEQLSYAVMGGLAVRVHGIPRPTYDVDFQLSVDDDQLNQFIARIERQGYSIADNYRNGWRDQVGGMPLVKLKTYMSEGQTIDVDIFVSETPFQLSIMARRHQLEFQGKVIWFVSAEDLVLLKLLASRPRDLGDIADILFIQGELDEVYLRKWAVLLGVESQLEQSLSAS